MGLLERAEKWICNKVIPLDSKIWPEYNPNLWDKLQFLIDAQAIDTRICVNLDLAEKLLSQTMKFGNLEAVDKFKVATNALSTLCDKETLSERNSEKVNEAANLRALWDQFSGNPVIINSFESIPNDYPDKRVIEDFAEQMYFFCKVSNINQEAGRKLVIGFIDMYCFADINIHVKYEMANLLYEKQDYYPQADKWVKIYKIWAKNWDRLQKFRESTSKSHFNPVKMQS